MCTNNLNEKVIILAVCTCGCLPTATSSQGHWFMELCSLFSVHTGFLFPYERHFYNRQLFLHDNKCSDFSQ